MPTQTIAQGLKENRRLVTFQIEDCAEFCDYLKTRYHSELKAWLALCPPDSWKYELLKKELEIRTLKNQISKLEAMLW